MGAGKTTLLKSFSALYPKLACFDLDETIFQQVKLNEELNLGQSIERIGWGKFRNLEAQEIKKFIEADWNGVLALGGGALNLETLGLIQKSSSVLLIWIDTDLELCLSRIQGDSSRPLAKKSTQELKQLYSDRVKLYGKSHTSFSKLAQEFPDFPKNFNFEKVLRKYVGSA